MLNSSWGYLAVLKKLGGIFGTEAFPKGSTAKEQCRDQVCLLPVNQVDLHPLTGSEVSSQL